LKKLNSNWKKKTDGVKRYYSYKIKLDKNSKEFKGKLIEYKANFKSESFKKPFPITPEKTQIKTTTTTIRNYLGNINLDEFGGYSNDSFFNATSTHIFQIF
jgi:hypothetical protein